MQTTVAKVRNPLVSYAELSLPLPSSRRLWLAPSFDVWRLELADTVFGREKSSVSLRDLLSDSDMLRCLPNLVDDVAARTTYLYGLAAQCWEFHQQAIIANNRSASNSDASTQLWMQTRLEKL